MEVGFDYFALGGCIDAVVTVGCIEAVVAVAAVWADYTEVADDMNFLVWVGYCFVVVVVVVVVVVHDAFPVFAR